MSKNLNHLSLIDEFKQLANLKGILYAYRDGTLIHQNIEKQFDKKKFAAMCASVLDGAIGIGHTIGERNLDKIITELEVKAESSEKQTLMIVKGNEETFLTLLIDNESKVDFILNNLTEYIHKMAGSY